MTRLMKTTAAVAVAAIVAIAANAADAYGVKLKVTGVAVVDDTYEGKSGAKFLPPENKKLTKKYGIEGYPTALILDGDGNKVGKTGYREGGAEEYAKHLKSFRK